MNNLRLSLWDHRRYGLHHPLGPYGEYDEAIRPYLSQGFAPWDFLEIHRRMNQWIQ